MRINTNVSSLKAQRALSEHVKTVENSAGKLASGSRVRSAADDAASLALSTKLNAQKRSELQAIRSSNDAISEFQVAEGSMNEMSSILTRLRELSVQGANDTLSDEQRKMLNVEYMQLRSEMERIPEATIYNGRSILQAGQAGERDFVVGIGADQNSRLHVNEEKITLNEFKLGIVDSNLRNAEESRLNLSYIDKAITKLSMHRAMAGSIQSRLTTAISNLETANVSTTQTQSRIMDADVAFETAEKVRAEKLINFSSSVLSQTNNLGSTALKLIKG